jgi:ferredoxin-thioredoxin reductase catalytic subunit
MNKRFWRCIVCNDIHFGVFPPEVCPTCKAKNAYVEISEREAKTVQETLRKVNEESLERVWERFCEKNEFKLNSNKEHVKALIKGVLENEKTFNLKLCPCRIRNGTKERDLELLCPCNFFTQSTWKEKGECWCGLFVKKH